MRIFGFSGDPGSSPSILLFFSRFTSKGNNEKNTIHQIITKITRSLEELGQAEIASNTIGTMVMEGLKELDPVAYVRFASVYRNFREEKDFVQFVDRLDVYKKR